MITTCVLFSYAKYMFIFTKMDKSIKTLCHMPSYYSLFITGHFVCSGSLSKN